jgi:beta-glucosidase
VRLWDRIFDNHLQGPMQHIGADLMSGFRRQAWLPSSPFRALQAEFSAGTVSYVEGDKLEEAALAAKSADVVIVFAYQWEAEGFDLNTLALPDEQNKLIETVAAANPRTIVVLETGSPALMPWIDKVAGVVEAWYPGIRGGEALANILTGKVNPTGKLAITFPKNDSDLPHPTLVLPPPASEPHRLAMGGDPSSIMSILAKGFPPFQVYYDENLKVGYKWYDAEKKTVLFPFGFGLSYTSYEYSDLTVQPGTTTSVSFTVRNTGRNAGTEIAEVYASLPEAAGEPPKRLVGWARVELARGESKHVSIPIENDRLAIYDEASHSWTRLAGNYTIMVGGSSEGLPLQRTILLQ